MVSTTLKTEEAGQNKVSRSIQVAAPAADVFALIVDPHRHPELDGSGTVRDTTSRVRTGSAKAIRSRSA